MQMEAKSTMDRAVESAYLVVKERVGSVKIGSSTVAMYVQTAMEAIEKTSELKGPQKKQAALQVVRKALDEAPRISDESSTRDTVVQMIDQGVVADIIDLIVSASRGKVDVNKAISTGVKTYRMGRPLLRRVASWLPCCSCLSGDKYLIQ
jgi:hypothetical protein